MRIRKKWDLPSEQSGALVLLALSFLAGGVFGCVLAALSSGAGVEELSAYLTGYLALARDGDLPRGLWTVLWGEAKYLLAAAVLSITALGLAGMPVLFAVRGFFLSFPAACFCQVFGGRGLLPAFALFGLPALLWAPALFSLGVPGFLTALRRLSRPAGEGLILSSRAWWCRAGLCLALTLAAGLLEYWVVPVLLRGLARVIL